MRSLIVFVLGWIVVLAAGFALMIAVIQTVGSAQPPSEAIQALHLTDCILPCWLGITPGKTHFDEAVQRVSAVYAQGAPLTGSEQTLPRLNLDTSFGQIILSADKDGIIHRISLATYKLKGVSLGDAVSVLGKPTWVVGKHPVAIFYGCETFQTVISGGSADQGWGQKLIIIDIQDAGYSCPASAQGGD